MKIKATPTAGGVWGQAVTQICNSAFSKLLFFSLPPDFFSCYHFAEEKVEPRIFVVTQMSSLHFDVSIIQRYLKMKIEAKFELSFTQSEIFSSANGLLKKSILHFDHEEICQSQ